MQLRFHVAVAVAVMEAGGYSTNLTPSWEPLYAAGVAPKKTKKKKKNSFKDSIISFKLGKYGPLNNDIQHLWSAYDVLDSVLSILYSLI